ALLPLAENYLRSDVFRRVNVAQTSVCDSNDKDHRLKSVPLRSAGLWSELRFRLRRPAGILTGTIDKLLITTSADGKGLDVEIIYSKPNRFQPPKKPRRTRPRPHKPCPHAPKSSRRRGKPHSTSKR